MGSSGGSSVSYVQSPEQRQVSQLAMPTIQKLGDVGSGAVPASSLYDIPDFPNAPTMPSAQEMGMPDIGTIMPTKQWWDSLSPEVLQGIYAPYEATASKMLEGMGFNNQVGSAEGGYSGAAGAAMGKFAAESATQVGLQAWNMSSPALNKQWEAQYGQRLMDYQNTLNQKNTDYQGSVASYQNNLNRNMMPYTTLPGMMQGTYPNPVVSQGSTNNTGQVVGGVVSAAAAAAAA
jgi:hypothetical protein